MNIIESILTNNGLKYMGKQNLSEKYIFVRF